MNESIEPDAMVDQSEREPTNEGHGDRSSLMDLLMKFLESSGNILLIRGSPGAGKTTLALELLRRMEGPSIGQRTVPPNRLYVSSRVSPTKLRRQFPWINEIVDLGSGRKGSVSLSEGARFFQISEAESILSKILTVKHSQQRSLIVIDSWDGALRNTTEEGRLMLESAILSEPEESKANVVLVSEDGQTNYLSHLVDGVVTLSSAKLEGRRVRALLVNKLRGIRVREDQGLFSLDKGRFTFLSAAELFDDSLARVKILKPIEHSEASFSTGSLDLDKMLKGGVRRGSSLLWDLDNTVSSLEARLLRRIICANFVNLGGGCIIVPSSTISSEFVAKDLGRSVGEKALDERVRIAEFDKALPVKKWRLPLKGNLEDDVSSFVSCWKQLNAVSSAIVLVSDFDKIAQVYGEDLFLPALANMGASVRDSGALSLGIASRPTKLREDFLRVADYHLKMRNIDKSLVTFGIKPFTNIHGVEFSSQKGLSMKLTEIV